MSIKEKIDEQERRIIELIKENAQLKRDGLAGIQKGQFSTLANGVTAVRQAVTGL